MIKIFAYPGIIINHEISLEKSDITLRSGDRGDDFGEEAGQPLVVGDGAVTVLVHLLEQAHLLLGGLVGGGEPESNWNI